MDWLDQTIESFRKVGNALFGPFWYSIIRDTAQDAIGAYLVLSIGSMAGNLIAKKDFSSFKICFQEWQLDPTGVNPYVCYSMVVLDFALWAAVVTRLLYRAVLQLTPNSLKWYLGKKWQKNLENHLPKLAKNLQSVGGEHEPKS
jgi:hypothetical protein